MPAAATLAALALGALAARDPAVLLALFGGLLALALPFVAPVAHLAVLLVVAVVVPYALQNRYSVSLTEGSAGLIAVDVLLAGGLARAAVVLLRQRLDARRVVVVLLALAFLAAVAVQFVAGVREGRAVSVAGFELRNLAGLATVLMAVPLLADERDRRRLSTGLLVAGAAFGAWGLAQWLGVFGGGDYEEFGIREGVAQTSGGGRGAILGGRYAYPSAIIVSFAFLLAIGTRRPRAALLVSAVLVLNAVALLLTFQRAFWVATVVGLLAVVAFSGARQRVRAVLLLPLAVLVVAGAIGTFAPAEFTVARERLMSIGQYQNDQSVRYRVTETRHVLRRIDEQPLAGAGLGASIWWGRPEVGVPATSHTYSHNGYLWIGWKLGLPAAVLLLALLAAALARRREAADERDRSLRVGARAGIVAMIVIGITAPVFSTLGATAVLGVLLALAVTPPARDG